jgi:signal transduction histidine kinase/ligand-binding sensor domain-containing protein
MKEVVTISRIEFNSLPFIPLPDHPKSILIFSHIMRKILNSGVVFIICFLGCEYLINAEQVIFNRIPIRLGGNKFGRRRLKLPGASALIVAIAILCFATGCNSAPEIPVPENESEFPQPISMPLHPSDTVKISWPANGVTIKPIVAKFDMNRLPLKVFDSAGFTQFSKKPEELKFDWDNLPDTVFNYDALPSKSLKVRTSVLKQPELIKAELHLKSNVSRPIFELGGPLAGRYITCLIEDSNGFLWIASDKGIFRYDGVSLALYDIIPPQTYIFSMLEDGQGQIWVGTQGRYGEGRIGFIILDTKRGIEKNLFLSDGSANRGVMRMSVDNEGKVWATTPSGVEIIDEKMLTLKYFDRSQGFAGDLSFDITKDHQNRIWIAAIGEGIDIVDLQNRKIKHLDQKHGLVNDSSISLICDEDDKMWISSAANPEITTIDLQQRIISRYFHGYGNTNIWMFGLLKDHKGNVWMGTAGNGVEILNPESGVIKAINREGEISDNSIERMLRDKQGRIWIATQSGLDLINPENGVEIEHAGIDYITALAEDDHGKIWIATNSSGIKILDPATGLVRHLNFSNGLCSNNLNDVSNKNGEIWIISNDKGIDIIDTAQTMIRHIGKAQGLSTDTISSIMKDRQGKIWIARPYTGADILDPATWKLFHLDSAQNFHESYIYAYAQDKAGRIWVTSYNNGVGAIDPSSGVVIHYKNVPQFISQLSPYRAFFVDSRDNVWVRTLSGNFIINAKRDSIIHFSSAEGLIDTTVTSLNEYDHQIFSGTFKGVSIIIPPLPGKKQWNVRSFGKESGIEKLRNTVQSDIITREGEFLWGDKGITFLSKVGSANDTPVTKITGISIFNEIKYFADKPGLSANDTLWGEKNISYIKGQLPANILFQENDKVRFDSVTGPYHLPVNLRLPHHENYIQFHFAQPTITTRGAVWYRYILDGVDKSWSEKTTNEFSQNYANLSPGDYTFRVISKKNDSWSQPAEFSFKIAPPWWKSWWAYAIYGICIIAGIYFIDRVQRRVLINKERAKTRERELAQARKIEQAYTELKATQAQLIQSEKMASLGEITAGIAHEIQNPLNFINNFAQVNEEFIEEAEDAIKKGQPDEAMSILHNLKDNQKKINQHGQRADSIVKGMLQHSRSTTGQKEPTDMNALVDEYLRLSYHGWRAKDNTANISLKKSFDPSVNDISVVPQDIGRVILNLCNNAFYTVSEKKKTQPGEYEPTVEVSTAQVDHKVEIKIEDNGNGIPDTAVKKIFQPFFTTKPAGQGTGLGLSMCYDIIKAHGGEISVITKEGEGSAFIIQFSA